jgi:hypothetical protein
VTPETGLGQDDQATGFRALNDGRDEKLTATYLRVIVLEAGIIAGLWIFGRIFS